MKKELEKNKKRIVIVGILLISIIAISLKINKETNYYKKIDTSKTMAVYIKNDLGTYEKTTSIPTSGYTLNTEKSTCSNGAIPTWDNNMLQLSNLNKSNTSCYLYFDEIEGITIPEIIAKSNAKTDIPDFSVAATEDEGVYKFEDGMYGGTTYYWRGATTTNYVKFAGFCWRAIRINGDGTLRLIYDGTTCHENGEVTTDSIPTSNEAYNTNYNRTEYVGWTYDVGSQRTTGGTASNAKIITDAWYDNNIGNNIIYASKVADGKFCNDRNAASKYTWSTQPSTDFYYAGYERSGWENGTKTSPTLNCQINDIYTLKVGIITMDEVIMAGSGKYGKDKTLNKNYYLYNGQTYWTMTPSRWAGSQARMFRVNATDESTANDGVHGTTTARGQRPVINLKSDVKFKLGTNGTITNPYEVL